MKRTALAPLFALALAAGAAQAQVQAPLGGNVMGGGGATVSGGGEDMTIAYSAGGAGGGGVPGPGARRERPRGVAGGRRRQRRGGLRPTPLIGPGRHGPGRGAARGRRQQPSLAPHPDGAGRPASGGFRKGRGRRRPVHSGTPAFTSPSTNTPQCAKPSSFRWSALTRMGGPTRFRTSVNARASSVRPRWPQQLMRVL